MAVNKVNFGGNTLIDLTGDTLESAEQLLKGIIAHAKDGSVITGQMEAGGGGGTTYGAYTPSEDLSIYKNDIVIETGNTHASNGIIYCEDYNSLSSSYDMLFLAVVDGVAIGTKISGKNGTVIFSEAPSVNNGEFFLGTTASGCFFRASKKYVWVVW